MYKLDNSFTNNRFAVTVVGCGGTGGFAAEGICRLLPQQTKLVLIDPDRVEERNLTRQCFYKEDLGKFKSEALAQRLARKFDRLIGYSTLPVRMAEILYPGLIIGCVDNGPARQNIHTLIKNGVYSYPTPPLWWVDAGNGEDFGQVLIGNSETISSCVPAEGIYHALPLPTLQRPDLLNQAPRGRDCAAIAEEQGPTINLAMAALVVEVVHRLITGTCTWVQLYIDLKAGTLASVPAIPTSIKSIWGIKKGKRKEVIHE